MDAVPALGAHSDALLLRVEQPIQALVPHGEGSAVFSGGAWHLVADDGSRQPLPDWPRRRFSAITADAQGALWACLPDGERWRVAKLSPEGRPQGGWRVNEPASELVMCEHTHTLYIAAADSGAIYAARSEHGSLQRRIAGLDQVAGQFRVGRQPVGDRYHQGVSAGAQAEVERCGIDQHPVARPGTAGQRRVGQRPHRPPLGRCAVHRNVELDRAWPFAARPADRGVPPCDHPGTLANPSS
jgi:hypothetical protein